MPNFFSYLWTGEEFNRHRAAKPGRLVHAASNRFSDKGVKPGDFLYIWSFIRGQLLLIGRMEIDEIGSFEQIKKRLAHPPVSSPYTDHVIARNSTPKTFTTAVPPDSISRLRFVSPTGDINPPRFRDDSKPDPQTFRGVRQLTPDSAQLLDALL